MDVHGNLDEYVYTLTLYIAWHISGKYIDGFSCIIAIMNSSW